jgi:CBS-domain-containing membrane protein
MGGFLAGLVWFLLLARVSWSPLSYVWITIAGLVAASAAVAVLAWRGDRGVAAGLASVTALVGAVVTLAVWL